MHSITHNCTLTPESFIAELFTILLNPRDLSITITSPQMAVSTLQESIAARTENTTALQKNIRHTCTLFQNARVTALFPEHELYTFTAHLTIYMGQQSRHAHLAHATQKSRKRRPKPMRRPRLHPVTRGQLRRMLTHRRAKRKRKRPRR